MLVFTVVWGMAPRLAVVVFRWLLIENWKMPKKRQPLELWRRTRERIWNRDGKRCIRCQMAVKLNQCHIDHIRSGKNGSNCDDNLRTLCRRCHVLRVDFRHRGMIASALRDGIIDEHWREQVWE